MYGRFAHSARAAATAKGWLGHWNGNHGRGALLVETADGSLHQRSGRKRKGLNARQSIQTGPTKTLQENGEHSHSTTQAVLPATERKHKMDIYPNG